MSSITYLSISSGSLSFGKNTLFSDITFNIFKDDKICLIGKNGSGKSTLIEVLGSSIELDKGSLFTKPGLKIGYLHQNPIFSSSQTAYEYILQKLNIDNSEDLSQKKYLIDIIFEKLNIGGNKLLSKMSGGKLRRVALAECLVLEPDILLLDEPTNHLDIASIEWLEEYLIKFQGALILISHDRAFLENISNRTFWLDRGKLYQNNKGYKNFYEFREQVLKREEIEIHKLGKELEKEELWRMQGVTARRKRNQQRLSNFFKLKENLKSELSRQNNLKTVINLNQGEENKSKLILELHDISYQFNDISPSKIMIKKFSMRILKGEVIGIIGANGAGKTSLVKLIIGDLAPNTGTIKIGPNVTISYYDQNRKELDLDKTLAETLCPNGGDVVQVGNIQKHVVAYLKDFLFDSKDANAKVSTLSGGQRNRLLLAKLLANPGNFLILDEPTNDLDMETIDILEEILSEYKGTLIIISHDRDFIEKLVTRTLILEGNGKIEDHKGGYQDYLETRQVKAKTTKTSSPQKLEKIKEPSKILSYKYQRELDMLPSHIENLTNEIKNLERILANSNLYQENPNLFNMSSATLTQKQQELDDSETRWLELEEMKAEKQ